MRQRFSSAGAGRPVVAINTSHQGAGRQQQGNPPEEPSANPNWQRTSDPGQQEHPNRQTTYIAMLDRGTEIIGKPRVPKDRLLNDSASGPDPTVCLLRQKKKKKNSRD
jgi:hypothetical protein